MGDDGGTRKIRPCSAEVECSFPKSYLYRYVLCFFTCPNPIPLFIEAQPRQEGPPLKSQSLLVCHARFRFVRRVSYSAKIQEHGSASIKMTRRCCEIEASMLGNGFPSSSVLPPASKPHIAVPARMEPQAWPAAVTSTDHKNRRQSSGSTRNNRALHNPPQRFNDTQNFPAQSLDLSISLPTSQPNNEDNDNVRATQPPIMIESSELGGQCCIARSKPALSCDRLLRGRAAIDAVMKLLYLSVVFWIPLGTVRSSNGKLSRLTTGMQ
ncbi:hypothetical protein B0T13DRAFT_228554 [Neurospora crassa]|nr:hypothetical protein B0T13DRAFT_228554 [Neurospora crassa]